VVARDLFSCRSTHLCSVIDCVWGLQATMKLSFRANRRGRFVVIECLSASGSLPPHPVKEVAFVSYG
jgi:hypothetical protein